jgi:predicted ATPase
VLDGVSLTNFKAFARQELPLAPLTLLTGLNSSGKSTVLQALALLRQSDDAGMLRPSTSGDAGFLLNGELVELGTGQDVRHESFVKDDPDVTLSVSESGRTTAWSAAYGQEDDFLTLRSPRGDKTRELRSIHRGLFGPGFQYLKADRIVPAVSYPRSRHAVTGRGFLGSRGEHTVNYLRTHQERPIVGSLICRPEQPSRTLLAQTEAWLERLCPGVNLQAAGIDGTDTVRLSYGFGSGVSASNRYRPTNVGFGLTYALPIVVACLSAEPGSLVLLENPEAHLHPQGQTWVAYLASAAAASGVQIIMETHSDHVLNGVRLSVKNGTLRPEGVAVHFFQHGKTSSTIVSPQMDGDGMLSAWPRGFFDEWENSLEQLLD